MSDPVHLILARTLANTEHPAYYLKKNYHILFSPDDLEELALGCDVAMNNGYVPSGGFIKQGGLCQVIIKK